jgi:hypothetical protein
VLGNASSTRYRGDADPALQRAIAIDAALGAS